MQATRAQTWRLAPHPSGRDAVYPIHVTSGGVEIQVDPAYTWSNDRHRHTPFLLIQYTTEGRGRFEGVAGSRDLLPGDVFLANPAGASYRYGAVGVPWHFKWVILTGDLAHGLLGPVASREPVRRLTQSHDFPGVLDRLMRSAARATLDPREQSVLAYEMALSLLADPGTQEGPDDKASFEEQVRRQLGQDLKGATPGFLARTFGFSEKYFYRLFKSRTGLSPNAFIIRERCNRARLWLSDTEKSIDAIAEELGFGNRFYFTRVFSREVGSAPGQYRKRYATAIRVQDIK